MLRRFLIVIVLASLVATIPVTAQARRGSTRFGAAFGMPNGVLIYRPSPLDFKLGYDLTEGKQYIFLSGDMRLIDNRHISGVLHGTFGIGLYGKLYLDGRDDDEDISFDGGTRVPLALSVLLLDNFLEFFVELAPGLDLYPRLQFAEQPIQLFAGFTVQLD